MNVEEIIYKVIYKKMMVAEYNSCYLASLGFQKRD